MDTARFLKKGFDIIPAESHDKLIELREKIFQSAKESVKYKNEPVEEFFNKFHQYGLLGPSLNEKRLDIIKYCTEHLDIGRTIFDIFSKSIMQFIGPDVVMQKTTNLVIQQPGDLDIGPTHRDSPLNSPFEIVVWLPLVDTYKTKGMYVLDLKKSKTALELLKKSDSGYEEFNNFAIREGENIKVPFGYALFFWPGLVHGSHFNSEDETRWSLNMRYKNLFSPCGSKGLEEFFELLRLSPLAHLAFDYEKEAYG